MNDVAMSTNSKDVRENLIGTENKETWRETVNVKF